MLRLFYFSCVKVILLLVLVRESRSECRESFYTFCDNLQDVKNLTNKQYVTELVIGNENVGSSVYVFDRNSILFYELEKLETIVIINQIKDIKIYGFSFDHLTSKVKNVFLYANTIPRLRFEAFENVYLHKLSLVNNNIEYLHKGVFYNCPIEIIDFSKNNLESIEAGVFDEDIFLGNATKQMIFKHNKIENLHSNAFPKSLQILNLDYNLIKVLNPNVFANLENLEELTMSHNGLSGLPDVSAFKKIRCLDFSYNKIITLTAKNFNNLDNLEIVDLSNNILSYPCILDTFGPAPRRPSLQISIAFNRFTYLDTTQFEKFKDHIVTFYGNPWNCKCWSILEKFMSEHKFHRNPCDLKYFYSGLTPYCLYLDDETSSQNTSTCASCKYPKNRPNEAADLMEFTEKIKETEGGLQCSLKPREL